MRTFGRTVIRLLSLIGKEIVEAIRRPGAIVSLIFGPFLIMALFGFGYNGERRPLETMVVVPPSSGLPTDVKEYQDLAGGGMHVVAVVPERSEADAKLAQGGLDVVVIAPDDPSKTFQEGKQSVFEVVINVVDPIQAELRRLPGQQPVERRQPRDHPPGHRAGQGDGRGRRHRHRQDPLSIVAAPTHAEVRDVAPVSPGVVAYYGPVVLALILQHLAVTLVALSLVRERTSGILDMYRVAPVNAWEVLTAKVVAYLLVGGLIAVTSVALLHYVFHVPMPGDPRLLAGTVALVLVASLGLGLAIAVISDSERQAMQLSLLVLLASVFFSGFVLSISEFNPAVRTIANALPVTHGIRLIQDIMLRGATTQLWEYGTLALIGAVTLLFAWLVLRRGMARA